MSKPAKILFLAGSARAHSFNNKIALLASRLAEASGAEATWVDLKEYHLPLFDEDLEAAEGLPANAARLKELFKSHEGFFFASPEYNSSVTPLWKNVIDWCSRPVPGESPLACYKGKVVALAAASPGAFGGLRGLVHYRQILGNIGCIVLPDQFLLPEAHLAFAEDGSLQDESLSKRLNGLVHSLVQWTEKV